MKVLITGGAGFIGRHLIAALQGQGDELTVVDNFSPQIHDASSVESFKASFRGTLMEADVQDRAVWSKALQGQDAVVHLAAETGTGQSMYEVQRYESVNIGGTACMLDVLVNGGAPTVKKLVVASSRAVYGEGHYRCTTHGVVHPAGRLVADLERQDFDPRCPTCGNFVTAAPTPEDCRLAPTSMYGLTKQVQEQMVLMYGQVLGLSALALRYQNVFGPGQSLNNPYTGILAIFSNLARQQRAVRVFEDGQESRDFVYIDDVVQATVECLRPEVQGVHAVNVGSGVATSVNTVAAAIVEHFASSSAVSVTWEFRAGDIRHNVADLSKARKLLGYEPSVDFKSGLRRFLDWASTQEVGRDAYERSLQELKDKGLMAATRA